MKKIVLTGGGTAGHVTPNIALIPELQRKGYEVSYIGSHDGMEKKMIEEIGIPYYGISSGKLRRYFDLKNFTDPFKVIKGYREAIQHMKKLQPNVVFSKGGFVTVPVVLAAHKCKIPVVLHESDMTPGLANRICIPKATKVCANFPETLEHMPKGKAIITGTPIRKELFSGNKIKGLDFCGFTRNKPVVLIIGGSLGSVVVNQAVRSGRFGAVVSPSQCSGSAESVKGRLFCHLKGGFVRKLGQRIVRHAVADDKQVLHTILLKMLPVFILQFFIQKNNSRHPRPTAIADKIGRAHV